MAIPFLRRFGLIARGFYNYEASLLRACFLYLASFCLPPPAPASLSINYHFTRNCNYHCGFCFHTAKAKDVLDLDSIKRGLSDLKAAGMAKINFSGGEPFLTPKLLGQMVQFCKENLDINVSIVSNGSLIKKAWLKEYGRFVDILAVSCDSFDHYTNQRIGRYATRSDTDTQFEIMQRVAEWCREYDIIFKLNTVVNAFNHAEDMSEAVRQIGPTRWKVFQCLKLEGENSGNDALRNVDDFLISPDDFAAFIARHRAAGLEPVAENNEDMRDSYLILDEQMRFLNCTGGSKKPTGSILAVGVDVAIKDSGFDLAAFKRRGGIYNWSTGEAVCASDNGDLSW
jgi:radical S-adenosyl methionine domain-containing protein 2